MKKFSFLFAALVISVMTFAQTESVYLKDGDFKTDHITWTALNGNITITQLKGNSPAAVNKIYIELPRLYKGHILSFVCEENYTITGIEIAYKTTNCGSDITAGTTISNNEVTDNTDAITRTIATESGGTHKFTTTNTAGEKIIYIQNSASAKATYTQLQPTAISITYIKTATTEPGIACTDVDFGTVIAGEATSKELTVVGENLTDVITATLATGTDFTVTGTLTAAGGTLTIGVNAAAEGAVSDKLTLTSGTTTKEVALSANAVTTTGKGTKENPYTVADVVKLGNIGKQAWVAGYMVGCVTGSGAAATITDNYAASNIALSDEKTADESETFIPVQLSNETTPQKNLNLKDNATLLSHKVYLYGSLEAYFTREGLKAVTDYVLFYDVAAAANDEAMGTVTGEGSYAENAEITLKAVPVKGYQFVKWSNNETANPYSFTVTGDVTLTAEFSTVPKHIYAYNLNSSLKDGSYTFTFCANEDATAASLIFYDAANGQLTGEVELKDIVKGANKHTIAADKLPGDDKQTMVWAVELEANPVTVLTKVYEDAAPAYRRGYANVDANPESDFFGQVYVADRVKTKANSRLYVYDQNYASKNADGYQLGESIWDFGRFGIAQDGTLYLSDYGDTHSGIYVVNPADLTKASQFFVGTRESNGLIKNGTVETGSSMAACSFVGTGANTKLVAVAEDYTGMSFPVAVFNVGKEDGSIAATWDAAPSKMFNTAGNMSQNFDIKGCEKGVWVAQSRADGQNNASATSLRFYDWEGNCTWSSSDHTDVINGSLGGGVALTANEKQVILKAEGTSVKVFDVAWTENTPVLTLASAYDCGYAAVSSISLDYAGNMVVVGGTAFGSTDDKRMSAAVFSLPTTGNVSVVPAKKAMTVTKTATGTGTEDIRAAGAKVEKVLRNGQVLILVGDKTYNLMGQLVE